MACVAIDYSGFIGVREIFQATELAYAEERATGRVASFKSRWCGVGSYDGAVGGCDP